MKYCLLILGLFLIGCDTHEPIMAEDAVVQVDFETRLEALGSAPLEGQAHSGAAKFSKGVTGKALSSPGDGRWVEFRSKNTLTVGDTVEISFDFKRADGPNPNTRKSFNQTVVVVSSMTPTKIGHVSFNVRTDSRPRLTVSFEDGDGTRYKLRSDAGSVTTGWHNARLQINREAGSSTLYLDGALIASERAVSAVVENGIDRIKFGTWHKQNQAYRGDIDNFLIREASAS